MRKKWLRLIRAQGTAGFDQNRFAEDFKTYRHAYETTLADRDRWINENRKLADRVERLRAALTALDRDRPSTVAAVKGAQPGDNVVTAAAGAGNPPLPSLFCVGAPKSGTSYIYSILREHPKIFMGGKDDHHLLRARLKLEEVLDLYAKLAAMSKRYERSDIEAILGSTLTDYGIQRYLTAFSRGWQGQPLTCDFGVSYMSWRLTAQAIKRQINPQAKILFCLRHPVVRALSEYKMRLRQYVPSHHGFVEKCEFLTALEKEPERERGSLLYDLYYAYVSGSRYYTHMKRFFDEFDPDQIKVLVFEEDIVQSLPATIVDLFRFLGLDDVEVYDIAFRDHSLYADVSRGPEVVRISAELSDGTIVDDCAATGLPHGNSIRAISIDSDSNNQLALRIENPTEDEVATACLLPKRHATRLSLDEEERIYMQYFHEEVTRLESLLQRDLSVWYRRYRRGPGSQSAGG